MSNEGDSLAQKARSNFGKPSRRDPAVKIVSSTGSMCFQKPPACSKIDEDDDEQIAKKYGEQSCAQQRPGHRYIDLPAHVRCPALTM